ncbi:TPA: hypothetical protein JA361_12645, partial [Legionella pneumophila]|nr:hypothetical protein [Legionella pneumophila]HAT8183704.1 hypothetical protein [Legionella pneumophila]
MPKRPIIQDISVISDLTPSSQGEAFNPGAPASQNPMTPIERHDMLVRLEKSISDLMIDSEKTYQNNCYKPGTTEVDLDYICRLSTNEFFFFTREPLTLKEFEALQNKLVDEAKKRPSGLQLILGSFAVKTESGKVMNVVPHITCGQLPNFNFIVKSYTSPVDFRYQIPDGKGNTSLLEALDVTNPDNPMPSITVNGATVDLSFNNIVTCKTPGEASFLTAVDICLDHAKGVAKQNFEALSARHPETSKKPISHVVVSNWVDLISTQCLGSFVMHADPCCSPKRCKAGIAQKAVFRGKLAFGNNYFTRYELEKSAILTKEDELKIQENKYILINELKRIPNSNWQNILLALPEVLGVLNETYPLPSYDSQGNQVYFTIAEQVIFS